MKLKHIEIVLISNHFVLVYFVTFACNDNYFQNEKKLETNLWHRFSSIDSCKWNVSSNKQIENVLKPTSVGIYLMCVCVSECLDKPFHWFQTKYIFNDLRNLLCWVHITFSKVLFMVIHILLGHLCHIVNDKCD